MTKQVVAGDTLRFDLVFRPQRPGEHSFSLPLSLEGIPPDGAKRLRVPVSAVGLKPTLTFASTEVDFGRKVVSRDPCALKQYQGEFVLRNASDKARVRERWIRSWSVGGKHSVDGVVSSFHRKRMTGFNKRAARVEASLCWSLQILESAVATISSHPNFSTTVFSVEKIRPLTLFTTRITDTNPNTWMRLLPCHSLPSPPLFALDVSLLM